MPAPIVVVHDDPEFLAQAEMALRSVGLELVAFQSSLAAINAVERAETVRVLVTRDNFNARGDPNGISLVMMARQKRPKLKAVFLCSDETRTVVADYGIALRAPVEAAEIVRVVREVLAEEQACNS